MIWTSLLIYRMLKNFMKEQEEEEQQEPLPVYEPLPPLYELLSPIGGWFNNKIWCKCIINCNLISFINLF
jgi:hypothetical protein